MVKPAAFPYNSRILASSRWSLASGPYPVPQSWKLSFWKKNSPRFFLYTACYANSPPPHSSTVRQPESATTFKCWLLSLSVSSCFASDNVPPFDFLDFPFSALQMLFPLENWNFYLIRRPPLALLHLAWKHFFHPPYFAPPLLLCPSPFAFSPLPRRLATISVAPRGWEGLYGLSVSPSPLS